MKANDPPGAPAGEPLLTLASDGYKFSNRRKLRLLNLAGANDGFHSLAVLAPLSTKALY